METPRAAGPPAWSPWGTAGRLAAFTLAYFGLAQLGLLFAFDGSLASPIWPPAGLAIAFAILWGRRVLPAVFAGALAVELTGTQSALAAVLMAAGNTAEAAVGGWLGRRAGGIAAFRSMPGVLGFGGAVLVAALPAATAGTAGLLWAGQTTASTAMATWWTWFLGDAAGAFVVAPVILLAGRLRPDRWSRRLTVEAGVAAFAVGAVAAIVFRLVPFVDPGEVPLLFLLMPPLVWAAFRVGPAVTALLVMLLDVIAVLATRSGVGPFVGLDPNVAYLALQAFLFTIGAMALALSGAAWERRRSSADLELRVLQQVDEAQRAAHIGSWTWDVSKPHATWSAELYRIYGLDPATHVPTYDDYLTRVHPDDVAKVKAATEAVMRDRKPYSHDERIRRPDGSWRDLHSWAHAVVGPDGRLQALVGACQDVTEEKASQRALQESLERFRALADASPIGIVHTRSDGIVDYVNDKWRQITGVADHTDREAMRRSVHPEDQPAAADLWRACVKEGREFACDMRFVHADGAVRWTRARAVPVHSDDGVITGFVSALADITEQRAAEAKDREVRRLREQAEFKTNFLRTAAHELGTPLTPIKIQMRILRDLLKAEGRQGMEDERKAAEILDRNINRLHVLVRDMLESARLQSGRLRLSLRPMDMAQVVHEVVETFQGPAIQNGVVLDTQGPAVLPMLGDPDRLSQVLYNLLSNAMKFTPPDGAIHVRWAAEPGDKVRVTVQDTGAGFDAEQGAQLFQPFVQLHEPSLKPRSGSGLGLYISRGIVEQHGGRLTAESAGPGKGATFSFVLSASTLPLAGSPLDRAEAPHAAPMDEPGITAT